MRETKVIQHWSSEKNKWFVDSETTEGDTGLLAKAKKPEGACRPRRKAQGRGGRLRSPTRPPPLPTVQLSPEQEPLSDAGHLRRILDRGGSARASRRAAPRPSPRAASSSSSLAEAAPFAAATRLAPGFFFTCAFCGSSSANYCGRVCPSISPGGVRLIPDWAAGEQTGRLAPDRLADGLRPFADRVDWREPRVRRVRRGARR